MHPPTQQKTQIVSPFLGLAVHLEVYLKKTFSHPKADENLRKLFRQKVETYQEQEKPLVFIDESGFSYDLPRNHVYSPKGQLFYGCKDWLAKGRTNAIGTLLGTILLTVTLFDGNINSNVFYSWINQCLIPVLPQKSVLFMDNVSFHKREDILNKLQDASTYPAEDTNSKPLSRSCRAS